jgi:hypothetical protein
MPIILLIHAIRGKGLNFRLYDPIHTIHDALESAKRLDPQFLFSTVTVDDSLVIRWLSHPSCCLPPLGRCLWVPSINKVLASGGVNVERVRIGDWIEFWPVELTPA